MGCFDLFEKRSFRFDKKSKNIMIGFEDDRIFKTIYLKGMNLSSDSFKEENRIVLKWKNDSFVMKTNF